MSRDVPIRTTIALPLQLLTLPPPQTVSEIFKDLAHIVDEQQGEIDNIETLMEQSNVHAKAGLEQVQKANEYQPGCSVM